MRYRWSGESILLEIQTRIQDSELFCFEISENVNEQLSEIFFSSLHYLFLNLIQKEINIGRSFGFRIENETIKEQQAVSLLWLYCEYADQQLCARWNSCGLCVISPVSLHFCWFVIKGNTMHWCVDVEHRRWHFPNGVMWLTSGVSIFSSSSSSSSSPLHLRQTTAVCLRENAFQMLTISEHERKHTQNKLNLGEFCVNCGRKLPPFIKGFF